MNHPWQYDEYSHVGVDYSDIQEVEAFDRLMLQFRDLAGEVESMALALEPGPDSCLWDIGTGTGDMALGLAHLCRQVYASDVSSAMLDFARQKAKDRKIENVSFEKGGFLSGFCPPAPVDGVVSQLALHHLPDFWKLGALQRIRDHLKPKGRFFLKDVVFPEEEKDYHAFFARIIDDFRVQVGPRLAQETILHIKKEYSTFDWVLEGLFSKAGFTIIKKESAGFLVSYTVEKG